MGNFDKMKKAYEASSKIMEKRMEKERPQDLEVLKKVSESSIVIVAGVYDKIETVLDLIKVPYVLIQPQDLHQIQLKPEQIFIVNCPGRLNEKDLVKIKQFVQRGGFLFTTDWALHNVLEKIFPEYVRYNQRPTVDDCVAVQVVDKSNKFLEGLFKSDEEPIWWLESSSYPIQIIDKQNVKVLVTSKEMEKKYGEAPIVITFNYGDGGRILHMTSHYFLQRAELRTNRHKKSASEFATKEMGLSSTDAASEEFKGVSLGEAESAYSTTQFISNVIIEQQKSVMAKKSKIKSNESIKEKKEDLKKEEK